MDLAQLARSVERIGRRVLTTISRGKVKTGDDTGDVQRLQIKLGDNEVRDNTLRMAEFGFASMPPVGADVVVLFVGGDRSNGVIIATGDIASRMKNMKPGESAIYDSQGKQIYLSQDGLVINANNQAVTINDAQQVTINSSDGIALNDNVTISKDLTIQGSVNVDGEVTASGEGTFNGVKVSQHLHPFEAQAGAARLITEEPQG